MYTQKELVKQPNGTLGPAAITSTGVVGPNYLMMNSGRVSRVYFRVTTAVSSTASPVLQVIRRPAYGSSTNQVVLATINLPLTQAIDTISYQDVAANILPGDQIVLNVQTAATGTGNGIWDFEYDYTPDVAGNFANMSTQNPVVE